MKKLSFLFCIIIITILTLSLCVACSGGPAEPTEPTQPTESEQPAEQVVLRLTLVQPPMDPIGAETIAMGERFNERAGDAYKIEVYPAEQLAKYTETMDAVRTGPRVDPVGRHPGKNRRGRIRRIGRPEGRAGRYEYERRIC
ncbi:MAG: hypothetical protein P8105_02230, partial [Dehalococcoidia bacterium]